ncbi:MAG: hypothetical protein QXL96_05945 [Ignisphaera sp.]
MVWIKEKCKIVSFPINSVKHNVKVLSSYVHIVLSLASNADVYVLLEPTPIPIKINDVKRYIVFPPLSAIICSNIAYNLFDSTYEIIDGVWAKVGIVTPFVSTNICGSAKALNLYLDINPIKGIPYLCLDRAFIDYEIGEKILNGGFIEIICDQRDVGYRVATEIVWEPLYIILNNIINLILPNQFNVITFTPITINRSLHQYTKTIVTVDGKPAIMKIGKGLVFSMDTTREITSILYHIMILIAFTTSLEI